MAFEGEKITVDFGPYFDFVDCLPDEPENARDVTVVTGQQVQNLRYRNYVGKEMHFMFNIRIITREQMFDDNIDDNFDWLLLPLAPGIIDPQERELDTWRLWDRNQFVFWASYGDGSIRRFLEPVHRRMRTNAGIDELDRVDKGQMMAEFTAWLHQPLLRRLHSQRQLIASRTNEVLNDPISGSHRSRSPLEQEITDPFQWVAPEVLDGGDEFRKKLNRRLEASLWCFHDVLRIEMREQVRNLHQGGEQSDAVNAYDGVDDDDEAGAVDSVDQDEAEEGARDFPMDNRFLHNWSRMKPFREMHKVYQKATYARMQRFTAAGANESTQKIDFCRVDVVPYSGKVAKDKLKEVFFGETGLMNPLEPNGDNIRYKS